MTMFDPSTPTDIAPPQPMPKRGGRALTVFTNSELQALRDCRRKWWFAYVRGLRPAYAAKALTYGTAFHAGAEAFYRTIGTVPVDECFELGVERAHAAMNRVFSEWLDALEQTNVHIDDQWYQEVVDTVAMARWCLNHYLTTFRNDVVRLVPLAVEKPFAINVRDAAGRPAAHLQYCGVWDLVAWDPVFDDLVIFDHKTTAGSLDGIDKRVELDPQMGGYLYALREMIRTPEWIERLEAKQIRTRITGRVVYNVSRKKIPSAPHWNKDGTVSTAAIDTTPEIYGDALARQGEPDWLTKARQAQRDASTDGKKAILTATKLAEQMERWAELRAKQDRILDQLVNRGEAYVARREFWRSDAEIEQWRSDVFAQGNDLRLAERDERFRYRNPGHCTSAASMPCVYRSLCLDDTPEIAATFRVEPRHAEVEAASKRDEEV